MFVEIWYINVSKIFEVLSHLKKLSYKQKIWQLSKSKKEIRKRQKRNRNKKRTSQKNKVNSVSKFKTRNSYSQTIVRAPSILSVFDNSEETLKFFKIVVDKIKQMGFRDKLYFDLSNVEKVSVDAIMYLIATIKNTKRIKSFQIECSGNVPQNIQARNVLETCGFYKYVAPQYHVNSSIKNDHISITRGREADPILAGKICEFVHEKTRYNRLKTKSLFTMIIELMTNTKQHAYTNNPDMDNNWYVFVADYSTHMYFVFLDTGLGIPNTIRTKNLWEKIKNAMNYDDAYFIASSLRGELRSETNLDYRGKGLPEIYNRVADNVISDFSIVSGYGKCTVSQSGEIEETKLPSELIGTMLCWKLSKQL